MVNGYDQLYIERGGVIQETDASFLDDAHVLRIIDRIVSQVGRRVDESSPMVDARLPDGSRVNAIISPLALRGPSLTIRKFAQDALTLESLVELGTMTPQTADFLAQCVRGKLNILISAVRAPVRRRCSTPSRQRPATSASSPSRTPPSSGCCSGTCLARVAPAERRGAAARCASATSSERAAHAARPDHRRRGSRRETLDMLQAMNTGHDGSLTTVTRTPPRRAAPARDARADGGHRAAGQGDPRADRGRLRPARAHLAASSTARVA
jgi:pilus assembly protein CpaF